jgi:uncharacterized membrane protein YagU involved in acid resistance
MTLRMMTTAINVQAGLVAGFIATVVLSIFMIVKSSVGLMPQLNPIGDIVHVADRLTGVTLALPSGWIGHFVLGTVAWGIIYAALQASLPGTPAVKGLIFGALAWLAMMIIFMPLAGNGLFALSLGPQATVATLVLHLIYGVVLGVAYAKVAHE